METAGVIGGTDGPTAIWMSTQCSWLDGVFCGAILFGWLVLLVAGIYLCRHRRAGYVLAGIGAAWGAAVLCGMGWMFWQYAFSGFEIEQFDAATYRGAVGTVAFAYGGKGTVSFYPPGADPESKERIVLETAVTNGVAVLPAGRVELRYADFRLADAAGDALGKLECWMADGNKAFTLEPGGRHEVAGGFPLAASVQMWVTDVENGHVNVENGRYGALFSMTDTAGNQVSWYKDGEIQTAVAFEALSPDGACFLRECFEDGGGCSGRMSASVPSSFVIRPVIGEFPFAVRVEEKAVSRDGLVKRALDIRRRFLE